MWSMSIFCFFKIPLTKKYIFSNSADVEILMEELAPTLVQPNDEILIILPLTFNIADICEIRANNLIGLSSNGYKDKKFNYP